MTDTISVDIWSDIVCPWCAIGWAQFSRAVDSLAGDLAVEARFMPFELHPDMPPAGRDMSELIAEKYGKSSAEVEQMHAHVRQAGEQAGFAMDYTGEGEAPQVMAWNTHRAHMLLRWALSSAGWQDQVRLKEALLRAHFQQRRNLSDPAVLLDITEAAGFDLTKAAAALHDDALSTAVRLEEKRAADHGITSVPMFVVADKYILQGASDASSYRQALVKIAQLEAMA